MEGSNNSLARYPCNFCDKVFFSYQALGGHQNSHKQERDVVVRSLTERQLPIRTPTRLQPLLLNPTVRNVQNMQIAPRIMQPFLHPTMRTHVHVRPNVGNTQMPHHSNYHFRKSTNYLPTRLNPAGPSFHPYARRSQFYQNSSPYVGIRYPSTNPFGPTYGYPTHSFPRAQQQVNQYADPQTYNFFGTENGGYAARGIQINMHSSYPSTGGEERSGRNIIAMPSNAMAEKHADEKASDDNEDGKSAANDEPDLTLHL